MIEAKHISGVTITFINASSKEGADYWPGDIEVEYFDGDRQVKQNFSDDHIVLIFLNTILKYHINGER